MNVAKIADQVLFSPETDPEHHDYNLQGTPGSPPCHQKPLITASNLKLEPNWYPDAPLTRLLLERSQNPTRVGQNPGELKIPLFQIQAEDSIKRICENTAMKSILESECIQRKRARSCSPAAAATGVAGYQSAAEELFNFGICKTSGSPSRDLRQKGSRKVVLELQQGKGKRYDLIYGNLESAKLHFWQKNGLFREKSNCSSLFSDSTSGKEYKVLLSHFLSHEIQDIREGIDKKSALELIAQDPDEEEMFLRMLLRKGADVNSEQNQNDGRKTVIHIAFEKSYEDLMKMVSKYSGDVNAEEILCRAINYIDSFAGNKEIVNIFLAKEFLGLLKKIATYQRLIRPVCLY